MEPEFADFFAQQAAALEGGNQSSTAGEHIVNTDNDAQEASEQADFNKWMAEEFGDTDGQELQQQGDYDGGDIVHASGGGYSPSAVPYDHQQGGYSPSAPILPDQGYSPSNPVISLPQGDEDGSEMQQSRSGSQEPASSLAHQPPQPTPSASLQSEQADPGIVPGVSLFSTSAHHVPGGPVSSLVDSQSSTPIPVPTSPQLPQVVTSSSQPLTPMQDAQARIAKNIHDHDAWKDYLSVAENTADLDTIRDAYEEALKAFPNTASLQIAYLNHFLTPPLFQRAEALFARFLRPSPSVELWKFYLTYVRRINTNTSDPTIRDIVRKAYEFALAHVGHDMDSGQIWRDYIDFLKNALDSRTTWDAQQKMDSLRTFSLPPHPTWSNDDRVLAGHWKAYLKWEEGNPLVLEDQAALHNRIISAYRKAVARMRFFPDITWLAYHTLATLGKTEEAVATLKQGILSNPSSPVLSFAYAELMETQKNIKEVNDTYTTLIENMHKNLEDLQIEIEEEVAAARAAVLHGDANEQDPTTPAVIEAEDRARKTRERRSKDMEAARNEVGVVWVMLMRFSRRSEGLRPARAVFARARKDKWCPWVVYEAAALMEYHCTKAADVATKIFEIGLKQFADNIDYVVRYLNFLISINDDNNARALFERTISTFPGEKGRPLWERWSRYEFNFSDLAASQKLEQRMADALPSSATNPPIKQFAHKYTYLGIDAIASRDLGAGGRGSATGTSGKTAEGAPLTPLATTASNAGVPPNGNVANKRAASPARRRDPSPPPNKRFKGNSPPPLGGRGRDWESGRDRERGKRNFTPPRRDYRRDADAVPEGVVWFMSTLPSAASFDGQLEKIDCGIFQICPLLMPAQVIPGGAGPRHREVDALRRITGRIKDPGAVGVDVDTKIMIIAIVVARFARVVPMS
ncbi:mRNA 3'-end-processing protein rna14 [Tulasnella sp. 417]|nr:mRNA 3'-end-processing protein rna14 [Tulasnella sp. 417]